MDSFKTLTPKAPSLWRALENGDDAALASAIDRGADPGELRLDGWLPLGWAACHGKLDCLSELLKAGAAVNDFLEKQVASTAALAVFSPLALAALKNWPLCVARLIEAGADLREGAQAGRSPLMLAARSGSLESFEALLSHGADPLEKTSSGETVGDLARGRCEGPARAAIEQALLRAASTPTGPAGVKRI